MEKEKERECTHKALSYLIIGVGGTGGAIAGHMLQVGKDVTLIARGSHLQALQEKGLTVLHPEGDFWVCPVQARSMEDYEGHPDVIFVCVKGYGVEDTVPFIRRIAKPETVVIPILNLYTTGEQLQRALPELLVTDGCIYVASQIEAPGVIRMRGTILRVVFGLRPGHAGSPTLEQVEKDLIESGITGILSKDIRRDALTKFSYVSPQGACGLYYGIPAGPMQKEGEERACFAALIREIEMLGEAMGITFEEDLVQRNLKILDDLDPSMTTSLQRDVERGGASEIGGLIYEVARRGEELSLELPTYQRIAAALRERGL